MNRRTLLRATLGLLALGAAATSFAQVSYTAINSTYTQTFNTLAASGSNNAWHNNTTLVGWYANGVPGGNYSASGNLGSVTWVPTSDLYSFGVGSDRALGTFNNGSSISYGVQILNGTGVALDSFSISANVEKYLTSYVFGFIIPTETIGAAYSFDATSLSDGNWTSVGALNLTGPASLSFSLSNLSWAPETSLWVRWTDANSTANNSALAIDDFRFTAIPEPSTYALALGLGTLAIAVWRRWRLRSS